MLDALRKLDLIALASRCLTGVHQRAFGSPARQFYGQDPSLAVGALYESLRVILTVGKTSRQFSEIMEQISPVASVAALRPKETSFRASMKVALRPDCGRCDLFATRPEAEVGYILMVSGLW